MKRKVHSISANKVYIEGDAIEELENLDSPATLICLDDAWARPQRGGQFGVTYETHPFSRDTSIADQEEVETEQVTTTDIIDACYNALEEGGWLIADTDDWLLPRLITYLQENWGDVAENYDGGGYRRVGSVTYVSKSGRPDRSTAGMYLSNGGYSVVFAHKGETDRRASTSARQLVTGECRDEDSEPINPYQVTRMAKSVADYGSTKPIRPYEAWVEALLEPSEREEHLVVPCAGTAPAAIGAERRFREEVKYTCIDSESKAYKAFQVRRKQALDEGGDSPNQLFDSFG